MRSRCAKKPCVPSLPLEMKPTVLPASVARRGAFWPSGGAVSLVGSRTWRTMQPVHPPCGSQSTHTQLSSVTGLLLCPSQGEITAPKPADVETAHGTSDNANADPVHPPRITLESRKR